MRGTDVTQDGMFSYLTLEDYVPKGHPLWPIREIVNAALREMDETFAAMYADSGRDSIPPEQLLRGLILQSLYGLRSERLLCEQLGYNMLFRWFVGLSVDRAPWDHSTYTKNRDRLIEHEVIRELFSRVLDQAKAKGLLSSEHFSVDGTLVRAWASHKSFVPKDGAPPPSAGSRGNLEVDFKGQKRTNDTHQSKTDPDAKLATKSSKAGAIPAYMGHVLTENRNGLVVDTAPGEAARTGEGRVALHACCNGGESASAAEASGDTSKWIDGRGACNERQMNANGPDRGSQGAVPGVQSRHLRDSASLIHEKRSNFNKLLRENCYNYSAAALRLPQILINFSTHRELP